MPSTQNRIQQLRHRLNQPGQQPHARSQLDALRSKRYFQNQKQAVTTPFSSVAQSTIGGARNTYNQTTAALAGSEQQLRTQAGFEDQSNPYSQAKLLEQAYRQKSAGTLNNAAASGQLYSGSTQNQLGSVTQGYNQNVDQAIRAYQAALAENRNKQVEAKNTEATSISGAKAKALEDALNNPIEPSQAPKPPPFARRYEGELRHRAAKQTKAGHKTRAKKLMNRLANLP